jgi:SAM-dependent methyltransferase
VPGDALICPLCGRSDPRPLWEVGDRLFRTTAQRFRIHECSGCSLRLLGPLPTAAELDSFYPRGYWVGSPAAASGPTSTRQRLLEAYRRLVLSDHVRFVKRIVAQQQRTQTWLRLLDVGCGDGSFLTALDVHPGVGLDRSPDAAAAVHARGHQALVGDLATTPLRAQSFSLVTMFHYLEHVSPATASLAAVHGLLAPGGRLVVQVPNGASWQARLLGRRWGGYDPPRHLVNYTPRTLRATLERHGFEIVRVSFYSVRDNPTTLANSLAPSLYPPARAALGRTAGWREWAANLGYLGLVWAGLPFTLLESACGAGAAVMVEARPV